LKQTEKEPEMKPKNFPGRINDRRKGALQRLMRRALNGRPLKEAATLSHRIVPDEIARAARTKKDRSARGKIR
jgi:hypothetical protein